MSHRIPEETPSGQAMPTARAVFHAESVQPHGQRNAGAPGGVCRTRLHVGHVTTRVGRTRVTVTGAPADGAGTDTMVTDG